MSLDSDQRSAIEKLSQLKAGALFMKMGTGKTKVACDLVRLKLKFVDIVIWIAPASLVGSKKYLDEIRKWSRGGVRQNIVLYDRKHIKKRRKIF